MKIRKLGRKAAVDFFGKGIVFLPRAQAGFDVPNRNVVVVRSERGGKGRGRVPLHKNHGRAFFDAGLGRAPSGRPASPR